jgi:hypothetical protein
MTLSTAVDVASLRTQQTGGSNQSPWSGAIGGWSVHDQMLSHWKSVALNDQTSCHGDLMTVCAWAFCHTSLDRADPPQAQRQKPAFQLDRDSRQRDIMQSPSAQVQALSVHRPAPRRRLIPWPCSMASSIRGPGRESLMADNSWVGLLRFGSPYGALGRLL